MSEREQKFDNMLKAIIQQHYDTVSKMDQLKAEGKTKTATYRQLMTTKLTLGNMLAMYKLYGLLGE